jgi:hypothetical protein
MERVPAIAGWLWIKRGFALFRSQPVELSTLFMLSWCMKMVISLIPVLGILAVFFILVPAFLQVFMAACAEIERGQRALPRVLFDVFRAPSLARLAGLGALYLLAFVLAGSITTLFDGGTMLQMLHDHADDPTVFMQMTPSSPEETLLAKSILVWLSAYELLTLPLWFAGPLIAWRDMSIFVIYALGWFVIMTTALMTVEFILAIIQINSIALALMMLITMLWQIISACSSYASYMHVLGTSEQSPN